MKISKRYIPFLLILGTLFFLIVFFLYQFQNVNAEKKAMYGNKAQEIEALQLQLNQKGLSQDTQAAIKSKLQALYFQVTLQAKGIEQLTSMPTEAEAALRSMAQPTLDITEKRIIGIINNPSIAFPTSDFIISNAWQDLVDGRYFIIYAGALSKDPSQGVLIISDEARKMTYKILSPIKSGRLSIIDFQNGRLIIAVGEKSQLLFDIASSSFVDNTGKVIPPIPTSGSPAPTQSLELPYPPPQR